MYSMTVKTGRNSIDKIITYKITRNHNPITVRICSCDREIRGFQKGTFNDCAVLAIMRAEGMSYDDAYDLLVNKGKETKRIMNTYEVVSGVLTDLGYKENKLIEDGLPLYWAIESFELYKTGKEVIVFEDGHCFLMRNGIIYDATAKLSEDNGLSSSMIISDFVNPYLKVTEIWCKDDIV